MDMNIGERELAGTSGNTVNTESRQGMPPDSAAPPPNSSQSFGQAIAAVRQSLPPKGVATTAMGPIVRVKPGDTLSAIAARWLQQQGLQPTGQAVQRTVLQIAKANNLTNPDRIGAGQMLDMNLSAASVGEGAPQPATMASSATASRPAREVLSARPNTSASVSVARNAGLDRERATVGPQHPLLEKTLARAAHLGYIAATEIDAVRNKVISLAEQYRFRPDDLAVVTLMESDGMNPRASNGRCHGLIQFCEGPNRGAASVGFRDNARTITQLGVLDQLDLVGKYFEETGLRAFGRSRPASLDDLYLTVLTPAARRERSADRDLEIAGPQAASLHRDNDVNAPITRNSLLKGLRKTAVDKLAAFRRLYEAQQDRPMQLSEADIAGRTKTR